MLRDDRPGHQRRHEHDRPSWLDEDEINYLHGPSSIEIYNSTEGSGIASLTFTVGGVRPVKIDIVQK